MDSKDWLEKEKNQFYKDWDQVKSLFLLTGNSVLDITATYIAIYNFDLGKTEYFFIFQPYRSGLEPDWTENKIPLHNRSYNFNNYNENLPYFYIKDFKIPTTQEFYKTIFETTKDIRVYKYENFILKEPDYIFIGPKPILHSIEYSEASIESSSFDEWYNNEKSVCDITLKFQNPISLFKHTKSLVLRSNKPGSRFFFDVKLE